MELEFFYITIINFSVNLVTTFVSLFLSVFIIYYVDKKHLSRINVQEELLKGNMAVAVVISAIIIFVSIAMFFGVNH
jgi:ABC-type sulfate transport system permease component